MPALSDYLSNREIELIVAYLKHMAGRKQAQYLCGAELFSFIRVSELLTPL